MQLQFVLTYHDGTTEKVTAGPGQMVKFEWEYKMAITEAFAEDKPIRMEHMMFLAWESARFEASRGGAAVQPFKQWVENVQSIEPVSDEEGSPDPFAG